MIKGNQIGLAPRNSERRLLIFNRLIDRGGTLLGPPPTLTSLDTLL